MMKNSTKTAIDIASINKYNICTQQENVYSFDPIASFKKFKNFQVM